MQLAGILFLFLFTRSARADPDVRCANNQEVPYCRLCRYDSSGRQDLSNCNSNDCELIQDTSRCIRRVHGPETLTSDITTNSTPATTSATTPATALVIATTEHSESSHISQIRVVIEIENNRRGRSQGFNWAVRVCNDNLQCCTTDPMYTRGGITTFSPLFGNFGNCTQLVKEDNVAVEGIWPDAEGRREEYKLMRVVVQFDDGSLFTKVNQRVIHWGWSSTTEVMPLIWNRMYDNISLTRAADANREPSQGLPAAACPEPVTTNVCPRDSVRVHRRLPDEPKFCYYQECPTLKQDLSTVPTGEEGLGTGGYCIPKPDMRPQWEYCCNNELYFTYDMAGEDGERIERDAGDIHFPRCNTMEPY